MVKELADGAKAVSLFQVTGPVDDPAAFALGKEKQLAGIKPPVVAGVRPHRGDRRFAAATEFPAGLRRFLREEKTRGHCRPWFDLFACRKTYQLEPIEPQIELTVAVLENILNRV